MRAVTGVTKKAGGIDVKYKRGYVGVTIIIPVKDFDLIKASALKNCRSLTAECRFRVMSSIEADKARS